MGVTGVAFLAGILGRGMTVVVSGHFVWNIDRREPLEESLNVSRVSHCALVQPKRPAPRGVLVQRRGRQPRRRVWVSAPFPPDIRRRRRRVDAQFRPSPSRSPDGIIIIVVVVVVVAVIVVVVAV